MTGIVLPLLLAAFALTFMVLRADAVRRTQRPVRSLRVGREPPHSTSRPMSDRPRRLAASSRYLGQARADVATLLRDGEAALGKASPVLERLYREHREVSIAVVGGIAVLLLTFGVELARGDRTPAVAQHAAPPVVVPSAQRPAEAASTPSAPSAAPAAADTGAPLSGAALLSAWGAAGLQVTQANDTLACPGSTPRAYHASGTGGAGQLAFVFAYASPSAMSADWAVERGAPLAFRKGGCTPAGAVTYWNQNMVIVFPQVTDAAARNLMSDAFLRLAP